MAILLDEEKPCAARAADVAPPTGLSDADAASAESLGRATALAAAVAAAQVACGGAGEDGASSAGLFEPKSADLGRAVPAYDPKAISNRDALREASQTQPIGDEQAVRFLLHAQLSAGDADLAALRRAGFAGWLANQFATPPAGSGWDWLEARGYGVVDENRYYNQSYPADHMIWQQLMTAPDPMRMRAALALSEFFVVSTVGINSNWRGHLMAAWWDLLNAHAFGNFRELLEAMTLNPAMGIYLNTRGNQKENPATGRLPDENFAREVMQLMTIGLYQLNLDGTEKTSAGGARLDSYSQADVTNLARVFTGWDFDQSQNVVTRDPASGANVGNTAFARLPMTLNAARHSTLASSFLGASVPANSDGRAALKIALDTLFNHPNVGPFFARQMIQRLVSSNPTPAYVARVATAFNDNGQGTRGDLMAVWWAILLDPEANGSAAQMPAAGGKLREPMLRFVQWGRTFGLRSAAGSWKIGDLSDAATRLGQSALRSPSVFNFFRPGYVPPSTALAASGATAPEFQLVSESSVGGYLNFMQGVIRNGLYVNAPNQPNPGSNASNGYDLLPDYTQELALAGDATALVARVSRLLAGGQLSAATRQLIVDALNALPITAGSSANARLDRVAAAVLLVMASAEYLVQK